MVFLYVRVSVLFMSLCALFSAFINHGILYCYIICLKKVYLAPQFYYPELERAFMPGR
jgi:hypothetical protein